MKKYNAYTFEVRMNSTLCSFWFDAVFLKGAILLLTQMAQVFILTFILLSHHPLPILWLSVFCL